MIVTTLDSLYNSYSLDLTVVYNKGSDFFVNTFNRLWAQQLKLCMANVSILVYRCYQASDRSRCYVRCLIRLILASQKWPRK